MALVEAKPKLRSVGTRVSPSAIVVALGLLIAAAAYVLSGPNLASASVRAVEGMVDPRSDQLWNFVSSFEKDCCSLDREKLKLVQDNLIKPRLRDLAQVSTSGELHANQAQGIGRIRYRLPDGRDWTYLAIVNRTDEDPAFATIFNLLWQAWILDGFMATSEPMPSEMTRRKAVIAGMEKDIPYLKKLGLEKVLIKPYVCMPWDEILAREKQSLGEYIDYLKKQKP